MCTYTNFYCLDPELGPDSRKLQGRTKSMYINTREGVNMSEFKD